MTGFQKTQIVFMVLIATFVAIDLGLAGYLFWGSGSSGEALKIEEQQLQQQLNAKTGAVVAPHGIEKKLEETRTDIKKFYNQRVPGYWSQIASELHKLETANGVTEQNIRYAADDTTLPGVQRVKIDTAVASDYPKIARFINALERDQLLFVIDQISVSGQPAGTVQLQIKLETFLKGAA